jgi:long-chain fatty acid transport protein
VTSRARSSVALLALLGPCALAAPAARADVFEPMANQRNILPGGRAALLGGAFTAVADDSSASYYNPAGLAFLPESRVEITTSAYRDSSLTYEKAVNEAPFREGSEVIYPSFVGGTTRLGDRLALGYAFLTLDAHNIYQQDKYEEISDAARGPSTYSRTYQEAGTYIWAGGSAALRLTSTLSLGVSVFYYQRNVEYLTSELILYNNAAVLSLDETFKTLNTGVAAVYGLLWRGDAFSLGVGVRTLKALSDRTTMLSDRVVADPDDTEVDAEGRQVARVESSRFAVHYLDEMNPPTYTLGLAWHPGKVLTLSADALLHQGVRTRYADQGGHDLETTFDYSAGLALRLGPAEILGGFFTNNSMFRRPDPAKMAQPTYVNYVGESAGIGWHLSGVAGLLGVVRQQGAGEAQILAGDAAIQRVTGSVRTYVLSGKVPL